MTDDIRTEAQSLLDALSSWGDGPNWADPSGRCIPIAKPTLRRLLEHVLSGERARVIAWLYSEDARRYTEVGPLIAKAIDEGRHLRPTTDGGRDG